MMLWWLTNLHFGRKKNPLSLNGGKFPKRFPDVLRPDAGYHPFIVHARFYSFGEHSDFILLLDIFRIT